jgi:hypothetical protein
VKEDAQADEFLNHTSPDSENGKQMKLYIFKTVVGVFIK